MWTEFFFPFNTCLITLGVAVHFCLLPTGAFHIFQGGWEQEVHCSCYCFCDSASSRTHCTVAIHWKMWKEKHPFVWSQPTHRWSSLHADNSMYCTSSCKKSSGQICDINTIGDDSVYERCFDVTTGNQRL